MATRHERQMTLVQFIKPGCGPYHQRLIQSSTSGTTVLVHIRQEYVRPDNVMSMGNEILTHVRPEKFRKMHTKNASESVLTMQLANCCHFYRTRVVALATPMITAAGFAKWCMYVSTCMTCTCTCARRNVHVWLDLHVHVHVMYMHELTSITDNELFGQVPK